MKTFTKSHLIALPQDHSDRLDSLCDNGGQFVMDKKTKEVWKEIPQYNGLYLINNIGDIISVRAGKILKPFLNKNGYMRLALRNGSIKRFYVHRLVAISFIPNDENKPCVNHKDGNKLNNNVDNLEWCTYYENSLHANKNGLLNPPIGERSGSAKLKISDVLAIRKLLCDGMYQLEVAKMYGVKQETIQAIYSRRSWKHI